MTKTNKSKEDLNTGADLALMVSGSILKLDPRLRTLVLGTVLVKTAIDRISATQNDIHRDNLQKIYSKLDKGFTITKEVTVHKVYDRTGFLTDEATVTTFYITLSTSKGYEKLPISERNIEEGIEWKRT